MLNVFRLKTASQINWQRRHSLNNLLADIPVMRQAGTLNAIVGAGIEEEASDTAA